MAAHSSLLIDGHIHIYPHYVLSFAIKNGIANIMKESYTKFQSNDDRIPVWLLVERYDCNFFEQATKNPSQLVSSGLSIEVLDDFTIQVLEDKKPILYIFAGRQLVTTENLEILSLVSNLFLKDRQFSINDVIDKVNESGGVPAVNWAPGKWFFSRGDIVKKTLYKYTPDTLLIGDTSLRTTAWPMPRLMAQSVKRGFKIIAGSDPLPFENEEIQIGRYGFTMSGEFDTSKPADSMRHLLRSSQAQSTLIGTRNNPLTFGKRQYKIMAQ